MSYYSVRGSPAPTNSLVAIYVPRDHVSMDSIPANTGDVYENVPSTANNVTSVPEFTSSYDKASTSNYASEPLKANLSVPIRCLLCASKQHINVPEKFMLGHIAHHLDYLPIRCFTCSEEFGDLNVFEWHIQTTEHNDSYSIIFDQFHDSLARMLFKLINSLHNTHDVTSEVVTEIDNLISQQMELAPLSKSVERVVKKVRSIVRFQDVLSKNVPGDESSYRRPDLESTCAKNKNNSPDTSPDNEFLKDKPNKSGPDTAWNKRGIPVRRTRKLDKCQRWYRCKQCPYVTRWNGNLTKHLKRKWCQRNKVPSDDEEADQDFECVCGQRYLVDTDSTWTQCELCKGWQHDQCGYSTINYFYCNDCYVDE